MECYSVIFDKDTLVAVFFKLSVAKDYAVYKADEMGGRFRLRVIGGSTCFYDSSEK